MFDGVKHLDIAGPAEVFVEANRLGACYELAYVSPAAVATQSSIGVQFAAGHRVDEVTDADIVVVPGGAGQPHAALDPDVMAAVEHLVRVGDRVVAVCTGAFFLAAAGVLSGRRATTHWQHTRQLARIYPDIEVVPDELFVRDGRFHTSAGVTAGIDLALAIVEADHGARLARQVARQIVVYMQRPGSHSQRSLMLQLPFSDSDSVRAVVDTIIAEPDAQHDASALARVAGVSTRQLARLFHAELGMSPSRYVEKVRLEHARQSLLQCVTVTEAAQRAGFGSPEAMRRAFTAQFGMSPSAYRKAFRRSAAL